MGSLAASTLTVLSLVVIVGGLAVIAYVADRAIKRCRPEDVPAVLLGLAAVVRSLRWTKVGTDGSRLQVDESVEPHDGEGSE